MSIYDDSILSEGAVFLKEGASCMSNPVVVADTISSIRDPMVAEQFLSRFHAIEILFLVYFVTRTFKRAEGKYLCLA
ncbi:MAG: hypothetical protein P4L10_01060 [Acidobacteriaceae bacterium]|nr:hypothetical protein [Acidobacteriaceae bacterium]